MHYPMKILIQFGHLEKVRGAVVKITPTRPKQIEGKKMNLNPEFTRAARGKYSSVRGGKEKTGKRLACG